MSDPLLALMALLTVALVATSAYAGWGLWKSRRTVAWNVVNAALVLRQLPPAAVAEIEQAVNATLVAGRSPAAKTQARLQDFEPVVRLAFCAIELHKRGVAAPDATQPFRKMGSAHLARSAAQHIRVVRFQAELQHGVELTELGPVR